MLFSILCSKSAAYIDVFESLRRTKISVNALNLLTVVI